MLPFPLFSPVEHALRLRNALCAFLVIVAVICILVAGVLL